LFTALGACASWRCNATGTCVTVNSAQNTACGSSSTCQSSLCNGLGVCALVNATSSNNLPPHPPANIFNLCALPDISCNSNVSTTCTPYHCNGVGSCVSSFASSGTSCNSTSSPPTCQQYSCNGTGGCVLTNVPNTNISCGSGSFLRLNTLGTLTVYF